MRLAKISGYQANPLAATLEQNGLYATVGTFGDGFDGEYLEAGYGFTASDLDLTIG